MTAPGTNRDRALVYATLARLFHAPGAGLLSELRAGGLESLRAALGALDAGGETAAALTRLEDAVSSGSEGDLERCYHATFEPAGGLRCPPNEIAHTADTPQHAMVRNFELADIAGFYRAFGVEVEPGTERPDHIAVELEFMHLLAVKELVAEREPGRTEQARVCRDAQRLFLEDHLGRWSGRFRERLDALAEGPFYRAAGDLLASFVRLDAQRMSDGAPPGTHAPPA